MTQSQNENDHFDLDHFDHILGSTKKNHLGQVITKHHVVKVL